MKLLYSLLIFFSIYSFSQKEKYEIEDLKKAYSSAKNDEEKSKFLMQLIDGYFEKNKDSAEFYIKKNLKLTQNSKNLFVSYIHTKLKYAQFFLVKGDYVKSESLYNEIWKEIEPKYDYFLYNKYYGDFGVLNFQKGDFKNALLNFDKAYSLAVKEKNKVDELRFLNNKALAMSYLGDAEKAIDEHKKGIIIAESLNDSTALGRSFNNIGLIYEDMKEYKKALQYYLKSLKIKENGNSETDIANSLYNVAGMYKEIGEKEKDSSYFSKSEKYFELAIAKAKEVNYGKVILFSKTGMAQLATVRNKPLQAITIYKSVIEEAIATNDIQTLRITYLNLGTNYLTIKDLKESEYYFNKALPLIVEASNPSDIASLYKNLATLYFEKKEFKKAYEYKEQYYNIEKELKKNSLQEKISDFEVKYETEKKEKQLAEAKVDLLAKEAKIKKRTTFLYSALALAFLLGLIGFLVYKQQRLKNTQIIKENELKQALIKIENQNNLQEQRLTISKDLHDNIGSKLTFIISSLDNLKYFEFTKDKLYSKFDAIGTFTRSTITDLRDTIWAMNKEAITFEDLKIRTTNFIEAAKTSLLGITFEFNYPEKNDTILLNSLQGIDVYRIIQEAVNNAIKHAQATKIVVNFEVIKECIVISIVDNGIGFDKTTTEAGNGLNSMKKRAIEIDSELFIESLEHGTKIWFDLKINAINPAN
ncbi:tetratricopeptide repeat protein [Flavobacterium sp. TP390]|uniref:histidine kinase n=1 Tax=Flavobacterium profundi TaxID=1774945 RepID=A0A6I4II81_9FLAO|nr:tetratricopeptide repeat protein [Flavobacterium profundi]MVO09304.1 tetratricopeptide repeat protein [Flavobacterium profundi]